MSRCEDLFEYATKRSQMHANSLLAYHAELPKLNEREKVIVTYLACNGHSTDRQVADGLGFMHKSAVQPRISELIKKGVLREIGTTLDSITYKRVRLVEVAR